MAALWQSSSLNLVLADAEGREHQFDAVESRLSIPITDDWRLTATLPPDTVHQANDRSGRNPDG